jgi:hypothetical protein
MIESTKDNLGSDPLEESLRLIGYVEASAKLRLEIAPFQRDQNEILAGRRILYCVDTNIVDLFTRPATTGPLSKLGFGYGMVFSDDDDKSAAALGAALSRFIFYRLTHKLQAFEGPSIPLILLLGHDAEVRRYYDFVARREGDFRETVSEQRDRLVSILNVLIEEPDLEKRIEFFQEQASELFSRLFLDDTPTDHFNRFNRLIADSRIGRLSSFSSKLLADIDDRAEAQKVAAALASPSTLTDQIEESSYRIAWHERLTSENPARSANRLQPDIAALARLELLNRRLKGTNYTFALITGDQAMHRAAGKYQPFDEIGSHFANLYLRHPRAFLAADEVLLPAEAADRPSSRRSLGLVSNWLDALLAQYTSEQGPRLEALDRLLDMTPPAKKALYKRVEEILRIDVASADRIKSEWNHHSSALREEHSAPSNLARGEIERILGFDQSANYIDALEMIDRRLALKSERTWQTFFEAIVRTGYDLTAIGIIPKKRRSRNAPPIDFSSFISAKKFARAVISSDGFGTLEPSEIRESLEEIHDQDPTGYSSVLAFGMLFACAGRWYVASLLAGRAITIAERLRAAYLSQDEESVPSAERISGREAYYFSAVARRMSARRISELEGIEKLLDAALLALRFDKGRQVPSSSDDVRFESERAALDLTKILFRFFDEGRSSAPTQLNEIKDLVIALVRALDRVDELSDQWIKENVRRNVLINIFMTVSLMKQPIDGDLPLNNSQLTSYADLLNQSVERHPNGHRQTIPETDLVAIVRIFASATFGTLEARDGRRLQKEIVRLEHVVDSDRSLQVMPYDRRRYQYLLELSKRALMRRSGS